MTELLVLIPSPLGGPDSWRPAAAELARRCIPSVICPPTLDEGAPEPLWSQQAQAVVAGIEAAASGTAVVLVGHSGAAAVLPAVAQLASSRVRSCVLVDGPIPREGASHLDLMSHSNPRLAEAVRAALAAGGCFPDPGAQARANGAAARAVSASPRGERFYTEPITVATGWRDLPYGYVRLSAEFDPVYQEARRRGWPSRALDGHHFLMFSDPVPFVDSLIEILEELRTGGAASYPSSLAGSSTE